jgi:hypothetical protein
MRWEKRIPCVDAHAIPVLEVRVIRKGHRRKEVFDRIEIRYLAPRFCPDCVGPESFDLPNFNS